MSKPIKKRQVFVITMFPEYFKPFGEMGVIGKALSGERADIKLHLIDIKDHSKNGFKGIDSAPYGGGAGMVMRADILENTLINGVFKPFNIKDYKSELHIVYPCPRGSVWNQKMSQVYANKFLGEDSSKDLLFICGRYEGIDERFLDQYVDEFISIGDYILTGGELAVQLILDSTLRLVSDVLGNKDSSRFESFENDLLEYPQYTRPNKFNGHEVPKVLISGDHAKIDVYRKNESLKLTQKYRPDLVNKKAIK